ncbi:MAG: MG2 domain-containing protein [Saonia sp.]
MKYLAPIITILLFLQMAHSQKPDDSYETLWKKVENLERQALTTSALKVVRSISEKAKKEEDSDQAIKALLYSSKYAMTLEEDAQLKIVADFRSEIEKSEFPVKNILESYLANLYWQYFQQHRYQFYNRTKTETSVNRTDFRTWDLTTLFEEVSLHFDKSLQNPSGLQEVSASDFDLILDRAKESKIYRPTLYDLLAHTALVFYETTENTITRPAYTFEINDSELLCEALPFSKIKISSKDSTSLQLKAIGIYQQLLRFHVKDASPQALVDVDIDRLKFIHQNAVFEDKDQYYLEALQNSAAQHKDYEVSALYTYEIASLYGKWANTYGPKSDTTHQWKRKEALELCNSVISKYPKSRGAQQCENLKSSILNKELQLTAEQHIPVNTSSKLLVRYRNHNGLQLTAYSVTRNQIEKLNKLYEPEKQLSFIKKLRPTKQWDASLKNEGDYQSHSTEILLPPLSVGSYIVLATPKGETKGAFAFNHVQVTNIALTETQTQSNKYFQVIDRTNGQPMVGAKLRLNYRKNYDGPTLEKTLVTDKKGMIKIPLSTERWTNVRTRIDYKDDKAYFGDYYVNKKNNNGNRTSNGNAGFLFTDRSIYRPGQPLYFKGIAIVRTNSVSSVLTDTAVTVTLRDVNNQEVGKQEFTTNEFGSFTGEFIIPNNGLTGNFSLQLSSPAISIGGNANFSVEEYKRPKFETNFNPITETYTVNDEIRVKGTAKAYAGSNITDAKVVYRVKRVVYYPRWYYWSRPYFKSTAQEIAHGEVRTDASGNYEISFKAIPDRSTSKENLPVFTYEVTADVTDVNGETHSTKTIVRVGYHALTASVTIADRLDKDKNDHTLGISTTNLNGNFVPAQGTLKIYKLKAPSYVLRKRPWEAPDYTSFTKQKFKELFPHDAYDGEDDVSNWKKGPLVWETKFDTGNSKEIFLKNIKKWVSGKYLIELETQDKFGQRVKDVVHTDLYSDKDKKLADNQLFGIRTDKLEYAIGDKVALTLSSSAENLFVTVYIEKNRKIVDTHIVRLKNNRETLIVPVNEQDLGGFAITYSFSGYNSFQTHALNIYVPYPKTDLEIETLSFRDKLRPGTDETWTFSIKGPKGDQVSAELLASMYDASLDAFRGHSWSFDPIYKPNYYSYSAVGGHQSFGTAYFNVHSPYQKGSDYTQQQYDSFNWFGLHFGYGYGLYRRNKLMKSGIQAPAPMAERIEEETELDEVAIADSIEGKSAGVQVANSGMDSTLEEQEETSESQVQIRKNLQETAFFFPQLGTDAAGNVSFSFTTPEALTHWKLQLLAHTKDLQSTTMTMNTVTQKELMVIPNAPRFLREGDQIIISSKIANLTEKTLSGNATLELMDVITGEDVTAKLMVSPSSAKRHADANQREFSVDSLGNTQVSWALKIPEGIQAIQYSVIAKAGDFSDGEQNVLPILTNRKLVTETLPMWVGSDQTKTFVLEKLKDHTSTTLKHHKLSLEMTSNPAWYAVQALPYLMEYPYDCNEQIFSRYYANTLAGHIANSNPRIREVFNQWANSDALVSNLEKNQELKSLLIQETPWLRDAHSETEQKKRIALLFDMNKMKNEQANTLQKLKNNQMSSGAWAWFKGGRENRFITQHIGTGLGHLKQLQVSLPDQGTDQMMQKAMRYLDNEFVKEYEYMKRHTKNINDDHLSYTQIHYLYMRSFFTDIPASKKVDEVMTFYRGQAKKYWVDKNLYSKGLLALILHRTNDTLTANKILKSLKENSITSEELGMYWKANTASWHWHQAPIETQALLIEAFSEIENDRQTIDNLKIWLLKNKQTNQWKTTKATTEAVYALLLQGSNWLSITNAVAVLVGGEEIAPSKLEHTKVEAGTGYYKTSWNANEIKSKMGEITISKKGEGIAWGGLYWQYFEDLDKISSAETPLQLEKKLFLKKNTDTGEEISEITEKIRLKVGDLLKVRIVLRADRPMEFVHMKDMRASGLEPINVLSQYKWQDGLGYYESTKDASTNFFFDYLPKGVYVFEYDLRVNNAGDFSNGITTIQSMYAPEFSSHSEGVRIAVDQ